MKKQRNFSDDFPKADVRLAIQKGIKQATEETKSFKTSRTRKIVYTLASIAATILILFGSSYISPTIASSLSQIPIIGTVFEQSNRADLHEAQKHGLTNIIGETKTVDGISVTVDEVLYDQNNISIGLFIESDEPLPEHYFGSGMDMTIDGNYPSYLAGEYGEESLTETSMTAIQQIVITEEMPDAFELGLSLKGEKGEQWDFSLPIEKINDVKKVFVNHTQMVDELEISVPDLTISETGIALSYAGVDGETDLAASSGADVEFRLTDQDGREIAGRTGEVMGELDGDKIIHTSKKQFDPIDESVTSLTITPHLETYDEYGVISEDQTIKQYKRKNNGETVTFKSFIVDLE